MKPPHGHDCSEHAVRINIITGTMTSQVPEEIFKDCEVSTVHNSLFSLLTFLYIKPSKLHSFKGLSGHL